MDDEAANAANAARPPPPEIPAAARSRAVVGVRLVMLLVACLAVGGATELSRRRAQATSAEARFVCPMHPEVRAATRTSCPLCSMALEPIRAHAATTADDDASPATMPSHEGALDARDVLAGRGESASLPRYSTDRVRSRVLHQGIVAPAWVDAAGVVHATLFNDEARALGADEDATFTVAGDARPPLNVRGPRGVTAAWDRATSVVTLGFATDSTRADAGTVGQVRFAAKPRQVLVVPAMAILSSGEAPYVLVLETPGGSYVRRDVVLGRSVAGFVAITSGLAAGEEVATLNAFFLDAERRTQLESARALASGR